jgi:hypothetical protein
MFGVALTLTVLCVIPTLVAGVLVLVAMAPSDPCSPHATECAPGLLWHLGWGAAIGAPCAVGWIAAGILYAKSAPRFTVPPGWAPPPAGWRPGPGWAPPPDWPEPPEGWRFWT